MAELERALRAVNGGMVAFDLAAHLTAARRDRAEDWWALAWLRGTEVATDSIWARSPGFAGDRRARASLRLAGLANAAMAAGFALVARQASSGARRRR